MWVVDVAFHEECKRYPQGTRGTTPPILASMNNGAGKATNQSGFGALLVGKRNLQKNHHSPMISDLRVHLTE